MCVLSLSFTLKMHAFVFTRVVSFDRLALYNGFNVENLMSFLYVDSYISHWWLHVILVVKHTVWSYIYSFSK